ncbi:hypothetical protein PtrM4_084360 [Pyrenophora tritici-repentis]|uniref:Uncharacterized protein n=1 Tax=Pyrenophora tritici-repentis TaxID=45151 RepID=A0A834VQV5_9PLEO|nr:hypothetical protein PtrM4_084360 [Pyrenophora tritici-repentis]
MYVVATLPLPWAFVLVVGVLGPASVTQTFQQASKASHRSKLDLLGSNIGFT